MSGQPLARLRGRLLERCAPPPLAASFSGPAGGGLRRLRDRRALPSLSTLGGIGGNFLLPIYRSGTKRFSTAFKFGDRLAIGRRFGDGGRHELAFRFQHCSNAGIRHPNLGEDFLQIR